MVKWNHILAIAQNEFLIGVRNRWVVFASVILLVFALVLAGVGGAPGGAEYVNRLTVTIASLATLSVYIVPLIALLLSFDAIAGEVERGTLPLILASPLARSSVIFGKLLGHLAVLAIAIIIGFGLTGLIVAVLAGESGGFESLLRLLLTSIVLGAVFLGLGYSASALVGQSSTAAALAIGIWLVSVVFYDLVLLGGLVTDAGGFFSTTVFPWLLMANPADAYRLYNMAALDLGANATGLSGMQTSLPWGAVLPLLWLTGWIAGALLLAISVFKRVQP